MPKSVEQNAEVRRGQNGDVILTQETVQSFDPEDFVEVYNQEVEMLQDLQSNVNEVEEEIEEILEEDNEAMAQIHSLIEEEQQEVDLEVNSVNHEDFETYQELQQKKQQREQLQEQFAHRADQVRDYTETAEEIAEEKDMELKEADL